ncbi:hypothetical protein AGMMS49531_11210 [Endomicrobiia bacterium]|nr:hypothetical protein AGMMS49531_11210 [Endomicrobiia bacterium]
MLRDVEKSVRCWVKSPNRSGIVLILVKQSSLSLHKYMPTKINQNRAPCPIIAVHILACL